VSTPSKEDTLISKCNCILTTLEELNKQLLPFSSTAVELVMTLSSQESSQLSLPDSDANAATAELKFTILMGLNNAIKEQTMPTFLTAADPTANFQDVVTV